MMRTHLAILLASLVLPAVAGCKSDPAKDPPVREVVLYCSADEEFARTVVDRFTQATGIRVRCRYDVEATKTLGLVQRLSSEAGHPQADVFWSSEIFETIRLAREGMLAPMKIEGRPAQFSDPEGRWYGFGLRARVIAYNTRRVKPADAPKSIEDLLDPRWKDQIVLARLQFGTNRGHIAAMWVHYGPAGAERIFRGLAANRVRLVNGNSTAVRMVAEGQANLCVTDTDDIWVAQRNKWPVGLVYPRHRAAGTLVIPNTVAMVRGGPHPAEARALAEFLLGEEVEAILAASDSHNVPVHAALARKYPQYAIPSPMAVNYVQVTEAINPAIRSAVKILDH
jgi:iron(III) transport system substrate-binding protein